MIKYLPVISVHAAQLTKKHMNRFLILLAAFLFAFQVSNAQTEKGDQTLGINLGFRYAKSDNFSINPSDNSTLTTNSKNTAFNIGPNYSYFIADKLDIGANLDFSYNNANYGENSNPSAQSTRNYGGMIYIRKYFMFENKLGGSYRPIFGLYPWRYKVHLYTGKCD